MKKQAPSIFNDVIGPVMRGPSSSHTAASVRIGRMIRQFMGDSPKSVVFEFDRQGSLASTYRSQGSDIGLAGGLLGMETADPLLTRSLWLAEQQGIAIRFSIASFEASHPNTYRVRATGSGRTCRFTFISTGGGMIELIEINGLPADIRGDYHETLAFLKPETGRDDPSGFNKELADCFAGADAVSLVRSEEMALLNIKTARPAEDRMIARLNSLSGLTGLAQLSPVLPVGSGRDRAVPFRTAADLLLLAEKQGCTLWELAVQYECARGGLLPETVLAMGRNILGVMQRSIQEGLDGTEYSDRILGPQAGRLLFGGARLFGGEPIRNLIAYITAIMETKSAMGVIVAAPTAGSCGGLPGTLVAAAKELDCKEETLLHGLMAAAAVGIIIAGNSTFAAEECGCQAECGSGSAMAAAGLVQMAGGNAGQALAAASMALQNVIGMVCDPVANRVEVPCLGKNILAGMNAVASANMALSGFMEVIPLDETIAACDQAGRMLPAELRCTGKAGLSVTAASLALMDRLN